MDYASKTHRLVSRNNEQLSGTTSEEEMMQKTNTLSTLEYFIDEFQSAENMV